MAAEPATNADPEDGGNCLLYHWVDNAETHHSWI